MMVAAFEATTPSRERKPPDGFRFDPPFGTILLGLVQSYCSFWQADFILVDQTGWTSNFVCVFFMHQ